MNQASNPSNPDPARPASYRRRVLLAVSGLSPQIVTETVYALAARERDHAFVPTEVHLLTTCEGAERAELSLLSEDMGWFARLRKDYRLPAIEFNTRNVHVIEDGNGVRMADIRTPEDNRAAADFITARVREFTADPTCALHVSIAGGRKTMGFFLGYALSLYGRAQDRLSHVLVSEPFESSLGFFYPTPYKRTLETRDGGLADTSRAEVTLADIPFVSLRHGLPEALLQGYASFNEAVAAARASVAPPSLVLRLQDKSIHAGEVILSLPPAELALLAVFAERVQQGLPAVAAPHKEVGDEDWAATYLEQYRAIVGVMADTDATELALAKGMDGDYFSQRKSKLHRHLKQALGSAAHHYLIDDGGTRPRRYALKLPAEAVRFE